MCHSIFWCQIESFYLHLLHCLHTELQFLAIWWINLYLLHLWIVWYLWQFRAQIYSDMYLFHLNVAESRQNCSHQELSSQISHTVLTCIVMLWHLSHLRSSMTLIDFIISTLLSSWLSSACEIWMMTSARFELSQHSLLYFELIFQQSSMILWSWSSFWHCKACRINWSFSFVWKIHSVWC